VEEYPLLTECDVLVVGGGPAGSMAGVAAARQGVRTIILERHGFLGGNLTAAGIDTMYGFYTVGENPVRTIGGIPDEVIGRLENLDACYERPNTYGSGIGITFSVEHLKLVLEELALEAGAQILYHALVPDVYVEDGKLAGVVLATKEGLRRVSARITIDATGDADVVARAGGAYEKAGEAGPIQSCTTVFFMANVGIDKAKAFGKEALWAEMERANQSGEYNLPRIEGSFHATPYPGMIETNMTRVANVDATDIVATSAAETEGRRQAQEYTRFLRDKVPGFEGAYLVKTGCHIGVRETRRIIGDYVLQKEDVLKGKRFEDAITRCGMPIEDHHAGSDTRWVYVEDYGFYDIPFRCLIPRGLDNVLAAGRCLSATHDAHASARSSAPAMGMGQAAGLAAAMAFEENKFIHDTDVSALQQRLREWGAPL
jgi:ribulose 1,5-bisphosphate synthetase/thiazole synthase